jgi:hypothetical protein
MLVTFCSFFMIQFCYPDCDNVDKLDRYNVCNSMGSSWWCGSAAGHSDSFGHMFDISTRNSLHVYMLCHFPLIVMFTPLLIKPYEGVSKSFRTESITKFALTIINTRSEATQRVMAAKLTRLTHKIAIKLHVVAERAIPFAVLAPGSQFGNFCIHPRT